MGSVAKVFACLFCLSLFNTLSAQTINGTLYDHETGQPLRDVIVVFNFGKNETLTDSSGRFTALVNTMYPSFIFKKLGYVTGSLTLKVDSTRRAAMKTYMSKKPVSLDAISVFAQKVTALFTSQNAHLQDYFILPNKNILLMTYHAGQKGFNVSLSNEDGRTLCQTKIFDEVADGFFLDCTGILHVLSAQNSRQFEARSDSTFKLLQASPVRQFKAIVAPCVAKINKGFFFIRYNKPGSTVMNGKHVHVNSSRMSLYEIDREQYKELKTVDYNQHLQDVADDNAEVKRDEAPQNDSTEVITDSISHAEYIATRVDRKVYAPVFTVRDTILLFDFSKAELDIYNKDGKCFRQTPLDMSGFPQQKIFSLIQDRVSGKVYVMSRDQAGESLEEIDLATGKTMALVKIDRPAATHLQIYDDDIYYMVKPDKQASSSYLYRQRL